MVTVIENAQLVLETGILWDGVLVAKDGVITAFGKAGAVEIPEGAQHIDAKGAYVGPGFVDIHVHGGFRGHMCEYVEDVAEHFLRHGETTVLATPSYSNNFETFLSYIKNVKARMGSTKNIKGFYMEGPYMNPMYGSEHWKNPWRHPLDPKEYEALVDEAGELARVWAIAPEREGLMPFLEYARKVNPNVKFAMGHCEATPAQVRALGSRFRPTIQTHSMNATGRLPVPHGTRGCGPDEYCFQDPDMYAELISDSCGIHVSADLQRLLIHTKGVHRVVLITDGTYHEEPNPPELAHVTDLNFDERGNLSGSKLTMDQACRNIMTHTSCGIAQAFRMASLNPARAIGMGDEIGSIEPGKRADLVFVDDKFNVQEVMVSGALCRF